MTVYKFVNNSTGSLASAIGASDLSLTLSSGHGFGDLSLDSDEATRIEVVGGGNTELMTCTAISGNTLTVTRTASENHAFAAGATVRCVLDATALNNMKTKGDERTVSSNPDGSLAALYFGEEVYDSVAGIWYKNCGGTTWKAQNQT